MKSPIFVCDCGDSACPSWPGYRGTPDRYTQALAKIGAESAYIERKKSAAYQRLGSLGLEGWDRFIVPWLTLQAVLELHAERSTGLCSQCDRYFPCREANLIIEAVLGSTTTEKDILL